jgi:hypothetical protein
LKLLSLKVLMLLAPFAALSVTPVVQTMRVMVQAESARGLHDGVFEPRLEGKWRALVRPDTAVIVAGDSRAERQIVPAVITARTGWSAVNVATMAQDVVTLRNAVHRYGLPPGAKVLIISASIFQANDGAIDGGFVSTASLLNMTRWERARVYADRLGSPWSPLAFRFVDGTAAAVAPAVLTEHGFVGIDRQLPLPLPRILLNQHPWYRKMALHGARWRIFQAALRDLAESGLTIYLVAPPISPAWRAYTEGTFVDRSEREFVGMLAEAARPYPNVRVLDFYSTPDPRLGNEQFYDIQHVNRAGAKQVTEILIDRIQIQDDRPR